MATRILSADQVSTLLPMRECLDLMERALRTLAEGGAQLPLRTVLRLPGERGFFGTMPAWLDDPRALGLKAISVFPGNHAAGLDSHQGVVLLFDPETGAPTAILDAASITAIRTAAVSGAATRALARPDAADLAILGSGVQARTHLEAMAIVRDLRRVRAWSPTPRRLAAFVRWAGESLGVEVEPANDARGAVLGADLVCTVTASATPVVDGTWLAPGAHVNAVGASVATTRELDAWAVARSRLFVDRRESALSEAGDFLLAKSEGAFGEEHIRGEIGEVFAGRVAGRTGPGDITLFKSLGLAVEDLAAATHVLRAAEEASAGVVVELGRRV
ncbi:MAG: ornithine cyclodeaminase family protein [Gemmatimonadales bacterium]